MYRLMRNILIALLSVGWLVPFQASMHSLTTWLFHSHQSDYQNSVDCGFNLDMSFFFFQTASIWFGIVVAFWAFVAANKLWPIKGTKNKKMKNNC